MSLYGDYIKEREDFDIVENKFGFATFKITGEECYIRDIYVMPEFRQLDIASGLANQVTDIAKENGCKWLLGSVAVNSKGSTPSLKVLLGYGFDLFSYQNGLILFKKEII